jgi:hypothetical protein
MKVNSPSNILKFLKLADTPLITWNPLRQILSMKGHPFKNLPTIAFSKFLRKWLKLTLGIGLMRLSSTERPTCNFCRKKELKSIPNTKNLSKISSRKLRTSGSTREFWVQKAGSTKKMDHSTKYSPSISMRQWQCWWMQNWKFQFKSLSLCSMNSI